MKIKTNSDKEFVDELRRKIKDNGGHCVCSVVKNDDTICMCKEFRDFVEGGGKGACRCGLYISE